MRRLLYVGTCLLLACVLSMAVSCGGGGSDGSSSSGLGIAGNLTGASVAQRAFSAARGNPSLFTVGFITETLDSDGRVVPLDPPRRIESWGYSSGSFTSALFDNGYFVRENVLGAAPSIQPTNLNPAQFTQGMSRSAVVSAMGTPNCEETQQMAGRTYTYMRYNPTASTPAATAVLEDGVLSSVTAGFAMVDSSHTSADLCVRQ